MAAIDTRCMARCMLWPPGGGLQSKRGKGQALRGVARRCEALRGVAMAFSRILSWHHCGVSAKSWGMHSLIQVHHESRTRSFISRAGMLIPSHTTDVHCACICTVVTYICPFPKLGGFRTRPPEDRGRQDFRQESSLPTYPAGRWRGRRKTLGPWRPLDPALTRMASTPSEEEGASS